MAVQVANPTAQLSSAWLATLVAQRTTATGSQNDFVINRHFLHLQCNNASALTLTGMGVATGNIDGAMVVIENVGSSTVATTAEDAASAAANRFTAAILLFAGERALAVYDATAVRWRVMHIGRATIAINAQTGTTYTVLAGDYGKLITHSNGSAIAVTLPQATGAFGTGWSCWVENIGAGTVTITPTTSTIDGDATLALETDQGVLIVSNGTNYFTVRGIGGGFEPLNICEGRLTLTSATPVTVADVTAATTLYWALYKGNRIALYDGATWVMKALSQLSIAVPATTNTMYDVFIDYNAGTPQLSVTAWTNDTTRATALTTQNGVLVQTGNLDWRYVGSFRTTGVSGQTEDSAAKRYVWNYYHRVMRAMRVREATDSWTYTTDTWRQANGAAANQLDFVVGYAEIVVTATVLVQWGNTSAVRANVGIGEDSTSAVSSNDIRSGNHNLASANGRPFASASICVSPAVGRHYLAWLERSEATGTTTWYGDIGDVQIQAAGISGSIEG